MTGGSKQRCGAWSKKRGGPCQAMPINGTGRCRFHGGVLRSPEGVRRAVEASNAHFARWREAMGLPPWWRLRLVGMSAADWLAKEGKPWPEGMPRLKGGRPRKVQP